MRRRRIVTWAAGVPAVVAAVLALALLPGLLRPGAGSAFAQDPCAAPPNPIVAENCLPGNPPGEWDVNGAGDASIQGFATDISVNKGGTVQFKLKTSASAYRLDIYRMGYYGGSGARKVAALGPFTGPRNASVNCLNQATTGLIDCGNWTVGASWAVPANAVSGIYFARLVRTDTTGASHIVFVVRDDASTSPLLFQTSDTTWQAYNDYGGNSLYTGAPAGRAYKVSYNRPFRTRDVDGGQDWLFASEYPMVRWLEANGYHVSYTTGVDSERRGAELLEHKVFLSVGHDEYWSGGQRANVEAARNAGVHLAFFSGNEVFWKTRWENSIDGANTPHRTLVTYKETHAGDTIDPQDPPTWTGTWRDPRFSPPADGGRPENALTGTIFMVNAGATTGIDVPAADGKMRFWRQTSVATLPSGGTASLPDGTLGYEWDSDLDNGSRPAGLVRLSTTTVNNAPVLLDYGSSYGSGTATHHLTLYRHSSGALVFGAGTIQWSWGLDANHDGAGTAPDVRMQQATVNLLADMGVQPGSLRAGLVAATASGDAVAPTSTITSPAPGASLPVGATVTITGTATDAGGGLVGGVEVSVDGGTTWHPAAGRASWSYSWRTTSSGVVTIRSRAVDDSGWLETPSAGVTVTVGTGPQTCPCSLWDDGDVPVLAADSDASAVELGVKFRVDVAGQVTGLRFYKGTPNTGTHVGSLWTAGGQRLAQATFTNESASGWQQVSFSSPVAITAGTVYVASYHAPQGRYSQDAGYFAAAGVDRPPLHAPRDGESGSNGLYAYGPAGTFPSQTFQSANYWVDVVFVPGAAPPSTPAPTGTPTATPSPSATGTATPTVAGAPSSTPTATTAPGPTSTNTPTPTATVTGTPGVACPCSLWSASATPALVTENDPQSVELGVRFRADVAGRVTGLRFYKGPQNTGTHVGSLWTAGGQLLGRVTFADETASGWQQADFAAPVPLAAGADYVASYHAPQGRYSQDAGYFAAAGVDRPPLHAPRDGESGSNGLYAYGPDPIFPTQTFEAANYWVDVVFAPGGGAPPPATATRTPTRTPTATRTPRRR